jgi:peptidoglycan/xylan/chitin deacetylase (PgdA/CDA1 family)
VGRIKENGQPEGQQDMTKPILRRQLLLGAGATLAAPMLARPALADQTLARPAHARPAIALPGDITSGDMATITRVRSARPVVAMTFDDGPHHSLTPQLLDILAQRQIRATFYVIGSRVARQPELTRRIAAAGHEIGNHTWSHPSLSGLSDAGVLSELDRTSQAIFDAVGRPPVTMRPPYGNLHSRQRVMVHRERNLPTVLWSVDPEDWRRPGPGVVASRIVNASHPGAVILAHDIIGATVRAMPAALDWLIARGYRFTTVSELMGWPRWDTRNILLASSSAG